MVLLEAPQQTTVQGSIEAVMLNHNASVPVVPTHQARRPAACKDCISALAVEQSERLVQDSNRVSHTRGVDVPQELVLDQSLTVGLAHTPPFPTRHTLEVQAVSGPQRSAIIGIADQEGLHTALFDEAAGHCEHHALAALQEQFGFADAIVVFERQDSAVEEPQFVEHLRVCHGG
eukprot:11217817-Lingulodinium_polyedra.AAC.1